MSMSSNAIDARMMLRPIRPNPLIPTLMAIPEAPLHRMIPQRQKGIVSRLVDRGPSEAAPAVWKPCDAAEYHPVVHLLYTLAVLVLAVLLAPWFLYQAIVYRKYIGNFSERMGRLPVSFNLDGDESIWIHAVSVGEALMARAIIADLRDRYPALRIFLSTTTLTGQQIARTRIQGVDAVFFFPFDIPFIVRRTLGLVRPRLFIMMETEIWPNLLRACRRRGVKTMLVNGRISSRSYPRYRLARRFFRGVLADVDRFCMQGDD
jgi:3-deoxy-D-manno-octulosonic-acid transferase